MVSRASKVLRSDHANLESIIGAGNFLAVPAGKVTLIRPGSPGVPAQIRKQQAIVRKRQSDAAGRAGSLKRMRLPQASAAGGRARSIARPRAPGEPAPI